MENQHRPVLRTGVLGDQEVAGGAAELISPRSMIKKYRSAAPGPNGHGEPTRQTRGELSRGGGEAAAVLTGGRVGGVLR